MHTTHNNVRHNHTAAPTILPPPQPTTSRPCLHPVTTSHDDMSLSSSSITPFLLVHHTPTELKKLSKNSVASLTLHHDVDSIEHRRLAPSSSTKDPHPPPKRPISRKSRRTRIPTDKKLLCCCRVTPCSSPPSRGSPPEISTDTGPRQSLGNIFRRQFAPK